MLYSCQPNPSEVQSRERDKEEKLASCAIKLVCNLSEVLYKEKFAKSTIREEFCQIFDGNKHGINEDDIWGEKDEIKIRFMSSLMLLANTLQRL